MYRPNGQSPYSPNGQSSYFPNGQSPYSPNVQSPYSPNGQPPYSPNGPYQQPQSYQIQRPFQQQQFGPRFQSPSQQFTPPGSFYQPPPQHHDHSIPPYQVPVTTLPPTFHQPPVQNQHIETPPNCKYPPPSAGPGFNQQSVPSYRTPGQTYVPPIPNYSQPPPVQNYNDCPPPQNYNQPPPVQNFHQTIKPPFQSVNQSCNQPTVSPYQSPSPGFSPTPKMSYQPRVQSPESLKQTYKEDQCYQQQQLSFNSPRQEFNVRSSFRPPGQQRFAFNNQRPRYQQPQHGNRFQFQPRQQYQNYRPRGGPPPTLNNQNKGNFLPKKDQNQIACELGDCDFVGHASAVKEHQNLHHRLGLHKKVLYSNNSDAVKNWIEERKKKWPTKETIQTKVEVEDEKNKRGERIGDEDFQRFNKNNKSNNSGNKRFNNRKRPRFNGEFIEPAEEPMNGNLKRFAGIIGIIKDEQLDETNKPVALKLLEEYDQSSGSEPEEMPIVKKPGSVENKNESETNEKSCSTLTKGDGLITEKNEEPSSTSVIENKKEVDSSKLIDPDSTALSTEVKNDSCSKINEKFEKNNNEQGKKRKNTSKKESKPFKKVTPMRTSRTEVVERKGALLEALMGDIMRSERNTITQCICYIRNNMNRFCKMQVA